MNAIQSVQQQQFNQVTRNTALRKAAVSPEVPTLTKDESSFIKEKFNTVKTVNFYSIDGKLDQQQVSRGMNIDTRA